jgi:hypothetical protein
MIISAAGVVIRTDWHTIMQAGRPTQGVRLMHLGSGDRVVSIATMFGEIEEYATDMLVYDGADEDDEPNGK